MKTPTMFKGGMIKKTTAKSRLTPRHFLIKAALLAQNQHENADDQNYGVNKKKHFFLFLFWDTLSVLQNDRSSNFGF